MAADGARAQNHDGPRDKGNSSLYSGSMISERLQELNIKLPSTFPAAGNYLACVVINDMVHVGGHGPINGSQIIRGKVGRDLSLE